MLDLEYLFYVNLKSIFYFQYYFGVGIYYMYVKYFYIFNSTKHIFINK